MRFSGVRASVRAYWRSGLALGLALAHLVIFVAVIFTQPPFPPPDDDREGCPPAESCLDIRDSVGSIVAGRFFHTEVSFTLLGTADLPALLAGAVVWVPLTVAGMEFSEETESYLFAWIWLVLGTIQWWLYGIWLRALRAQR